MVCSRAPGAIPQINEVKSRSLSPAQKKDKLYFVACCPVCDPRADVTTND